MTALKRLTQRLTNRLTTTHVGIALILVLLGDLVGITIVPRPITLKAPGELADVIPELQRFVEKTRGRRFHKPVKIEQSDDLGRFTTGLQQSDTASQEQKDRDAAIDQAAVLRALGLVDTTYDPLAATTALSNDVLGVYRPDEHTLVVRPGPVTPRMRLTLVHELTHALDGEHHELRFSERTDRLIPDESATSFRALAEGDAYYVEKLYEASMSEADRAAVDAARQASPPPSVPEALLFLASYPYSAGRNFVENLVQRDGMQAIDRAFKDPPTTSEHVLNPDKYRADDPPRNVAKPLPRGRTVVQRGVFGELLLRLLVSRAAGNDVARQVGAGWGGGRYVAWRENADVCVAVTLVMDTAQDAQELQDAIAKWAATKPRSKVVPGPPVAFENCVER